MSAPRPWYVRFKYLLIVLFAIAIGFRVYTLNTKKEIFGDRQDVPLAQRERIAKAYEDKMRKREADRKNPPAAAPAKEVAETKVIKSNQPRLIYLRLNNGNVARFKFANQTGTAEALKVAEQLEGSCLSATGSPKESTGICKLVVAIGEAPAKTILGCAAANENELLKDLAGLERVLPVEKHYLLIDSATAARIEIMSSEPPKYAGELFYVLRKPCADSTKVEITTGEIVKVYVMTRGKG